MFQENLVILFNIFISALDVEIISYFSKNKVFSFKVFVQRKNFHLSNKFKKIVSLI